MIIPFLLVGCAKPEVNNLKGVVLENITDMGNARSLVVIVPGYELVQSKYPHFFVNFTSKFLGVDNGDGWSNNFADYIRLHSDYDVEVFKWDPGLTERFSFHPAANNLADLLRKKSDYERVVIFSKSLGGIVSELALDKLDRDDVPDRLIYVASLHKFANPNIPDGIQIFNVFSRDDNLAKWGNLLLHFSRVYELKRGVNIKLAGLAHSEFNYNNEVSYNGTKTKLYDLYVRLITATLPQE